MLLAAEKRGYSGGDKRFCMKKNNVFVVLILILFILITTSGCLEYFSVDDGSTTYVAHPTKISYTISYGYTISCSGTGDYTINWDTDFASAAYVVVVTSEAAQTQIISQAAGSVRIKTSNSAGSAVDAANINAVALGTQ